MTTYRFKKGNFNMKNTIRETKIDLANNLTIDHANKTITVTKQFQKASGKYGSETCFFENKKCQKNNIHE